MKQVNVLEAKNELSKLMKLLETKEEDTIIIARNGTPVVQMVLYPESKKKSKIGTAKGKFTCPEDINLYDDEIADLFEENL